MRTVLLLACLSLVACGDDDGATDATVTDTATTDTTTGDAPIADTASGDATTADATTTDSAVLGPAERLCVAAEAHDTMCGGELTPRDECLMERECIVTLIRADAIEAIAACDEARTCEMSDDGCFVPEMIGLESSAAAIAYGESCLARRDECSADPFSDDLCFVNIASDATIERFDACMAMDCADINACMSDIFSCA